MPPAERRFCEGVRGTPSSGMQYLHLKLHLVVVMVIRVLVMTLIIKDHSDHSELEMQYRHLKLHLVVIMKMACWSG